MDMSDSSEHTQKHFDFPTPPHPHDFRLFRAQLNNYNTHPWPRPFPTQQIPALTHEPSSQPASEEIELRYFMYPNPSYLATASSLMPLITNTRSPPRVCSGSMTLSQPCSRTQP